MRDRTLGGQNAPSVVPKLSVRANISVNGDRFDAELLGALCDGGIAVRHGRLRKAHLASGKVTPPEVTRFFGAQLGLGSNVLAEYATRSETRRGHLIVLRQVYGFKMFSGHRARALKAWRAGEAENVTTNHDLARRFVDECRRTRTSLQGISVVERLCADALVAANSAIVARLDGLRVGPA